MFKKIFSFGRQKAEQAIDILPDAETLRKAGQAADKKMRQVIEEVKEETREKYSSIKEGVVDKLDDVRDVASEKLENAAKRLKKDNDASKS